MAEVKEVFSSKCYDGFQKVFEHHSSELKCEMKFSVFIPPAAAEKKCPVLYWLSGLTCTERNFIEKSGFQRHASKHGIIVVGPDTSPRGCNIEGEDESYDFGSGAGFYVNATEEKWKTNYRMYSYVTKELPSIINSTFPTNGKSSISGHSMGGHGALQIGLKSPDIYSSISAFAPICNPSEGIWGQKCFTGYLGKDRSSWEEYDATLLAKKYTGPEINIFIDQGAVDQYLKDDLLLPNFVDGCKNSKINLEYRMQEEYDHSYFFVSTFLGDHFDFHAKYLNN